MESQEAKRRLPVAVTFVMGLVTGMLVMYLVLSFFVGAPRPATAAPVRAAAYAPPGLLETSGFNALVDSIPRWPDNASLKEVADAWTRIGHREIERIDATLRDATLPQEERIRLTMQKAMCYSSEGMAAECYDVLRELRRDIETSPELARTLLATVMFYQGVAALRRGENENCVECRGESSCILPIAPAAVHKFPDGSRLAIKHFTEVLKIAPDDLAVQWLMNIAHMTLGEYPDQVPPEHLVNLDRFVKSEFDIGRFRDVGHHLGVNRFNQSGGSIMDDFDNDGLLDLVLTSIDPLMPIAIFRNCGNGAFEDRSNTSNVSDQTGGLFCCQTDYNNDGQLDIWVSRGAWVPFPIRPSLLKNNGDWTFTDVTEAAGLIQPLNSNSAAWGDYDNDGWVDVFIPCEQQPIHLYHNKGDGTFEEVASAVGLPSDAPMCKGATWIDYDNDDNLDLYLSYLGSPSALFRNDGNGSFTRVTNSMGIQGPAVGFSCWTWDFDNDGWLDIFSTSYDRDLSEIVRGLTGKRHGSEPSKLYKNAGGTGFVDVASEAGVDNPYATMGSNYGDLNNDGYLDFYLGTGDPSFATLVPNRMFLNIDGKRFAEITGSSGTGHLQKGHSVSCGDWDRDGDIDVFIEMGGAVNGDKYHDVLFQNPGQGNHALAVKLVGQKTNRAAFGARIKAVIASDPPREVHRHVSSGSSFGANPLEQSIGLGTATRVDRLEIHWPTSGTTQVFRDIAADQLIEITEFAESYRRIDVKPVPLVEK